MPSRVDAVGGNSGVNPIAEAAACIGSRTAKPSPVFQMFQPAHKLLPPANAN